MSTTSPEQIREAAGKEKRGEEFNIDEIVEGLARSGGGQVDFRKAAGRIFPENEPADAYSVAGFIDSLSEYIKEHKKLGAKRDSAVQLKLALSGRVFNDVQNLPRLADEMGDKKEMTSEEGLKKFITSFSSRYEEYVKEELKGKWRHCGDGSRLFSAILRAYTANLEVAIISADVYILSSRIREAAKEAGDGFKNEIWREIKRLEEAEPGEKESEKLRKECGHTALRIYLDDEKYIADPTQKQFNSTLDVFSVYKESDLVDLNGIIRLAKEEKTKLKSGELTGSDISLLLKHEDLLL
jgi:hypothetical protein